MKIDRLFYGSWFSNCYFLSYTDEAGKLLAAVIDPAYPAKELLAFADSIGASIDTVIMTHGHFDHIYFLDELVSATNAAAYIHEYDAELLSDSLKNAYSFFFGDGELICRSNFKTVRDGDMIPLGTESLKVISTPGHTKGSICLLNQDFIITGDTLFADGYGRYDLYGGDLKALIRSLKALKGYDMDLTIYAGHGEPTTLGSAIEKLYI